jgi:hypothetical protein
VRFLTNRTLCAKSLITIGGIIQQRISVTHLYNNEILIPSSKKLWWCILFPQYSSDPKDQQFINVGHSALLRIHTNYQVTSHLTVVTYFNYTSCIYKPWSIIPYLGNHTEEKFCTLVIMSHFPTGLWIPEKQKQIPWAEFAREIYRPSDRRLSGKLVPTFAGRRCHVVSVMNPYGHTLGFLEWSRYLLFKVAPQLYSRSWVNSFPDPVLLRKSESAGSGTRASGSQEVLKI